MTIFETWRSYAFTIGGVSRHTSATSTNGDTASKENEKTASYVALGRVFSNVIAGTLLFLPLLTLIVLISQGMFDRLVVSANAQTTDFYWADYGESCVLSSSGWIPNSCDAMSSSVTPELTFQAIGKAMAEQWSEEIQISGSLKVTTCIIGGTADVGWASLQFISGYDTYPECLPTQPQDIAGMAMLDTTIRDHHQDGLYFLTLYSDLNPSMKPFNYENSDGTNQKLMSNPIRTLFTANGATEMDSLGGDYIIYSKPLGERYLVTGYCSTEIEELSEIILDQGLTGWSQGKHSGHPISTGWACGLKVSNAAELIVFQLFFSISTLILFSGDIFVTFEGFNGVLKGKPVLTYAVLSGLERRKLLVLFIVLSCMPGLLYSDVSRIYYFTKNGFRIWCLSCIMMAIFFSFGLILIVSILDMIPLGLSRVVSYSASFFLYVSISAITIACCTDSVYQTTYTMFYTATPYITLHVNGEDWPSGSYTADGTAVALTHLKDAIILPLFISFASAIVVSSLRRFIRHQRILMSIGWCKTNSYLSTMSPPNFITSLPLEQSNAIRIGNKMYCKPSTQALMGYATVIAAQDRKASIYADQDGKKTESPPNFIISIYNLVPSLLFRAFFVKQYGMIEQNQFKQTPNSKLQNVKHRHTRGACVV